MYVAKHEMIIRSIRHDEIDLLEEVLHQAVFISSRHGPSSCEVVNIPEVRAY